MKKNFTKLKTLVAITFSIILAISAYPSDAKAAAQLPSFQKFTASSSNLNRSGVSAQSCSSLCYGYNYVPLYRFWSNQYSGHFYTIDESEKNYVIANYASVWSYEGIAYYVEKPTYQNGQLGCYGNAVYRFWSDSLAAHFYTMDQAEAQYVYNNLPAWNYFEGAVFCAFTQSEASTLLGSAGKPVYRFWSNPYQNHFYTISEAEKNHVISTWPSQWLFEGANYYAGAY